MAMVARGYSNGDIGRRLYITEETVKSHLRKIFKALGTNDRTEAVYILLRAGQPLDNIGDIEPMTQLRVDIVDAEPPPDAATQDGPWIWSENGLSGDDIAAVLTCVGTVMQRIRRDTTQLSSVEFAKLCGISDNTVTRTECNHGGTSLPRLKYLLIMCGRLGVPISDVFREAEDRALGSDAWWPRRLTGK